MEFSVRAKLTIPRRSCSPVGWTRTIRFGARESRIEAKGLGVRNYRNVTWLSCPVFCTAANDERPVHKDFVEFPDGRRVGSWSTDDLQYGVREDLSAD